MSGASPTCVVNSKSLPGVSPANRFCRKLNLFERGIKRRSVAAAAGRREPYVCRSWKNRIPAEVVTRANTNVCSFTLHICWICSHKSPLARSDTHSLSHAQTLTLGLPHTLPPSSVAFHVSMAPLTDLRESPGWSLGLSPPLNIRPSICTKHIWIQTVMNLLASFLHSSEQAELIAIE